MADKKKILSKIFKNPYILAVYLTKYKLLNWLPDQSYLKLLYRGRIGKKLNINNPQTFNEKLQWLKLHDRKPEYATMVDKYEVKKYVSDKIGEKYIVPTLGSWDRFDDIDFASLPNEFVLKCTHDSGGLVICKDKSKLDMAEAEKKINKCLKNNYYKYGREWPYKDVKPRIIAEKYLSDTKSEDITDYKLMCFNGKVRCIFTCTDRHLHGGLKVTFFDTEWNKLPFERHYPSDSKTINPPKDLTKMIELAEILSRNIPFVRVDFYEIDEKIYFGEITFYPGNGFEEFKPEEWDLELGSWIDLKGETRCES